MRDDCYEYALDGCAPTPLASYLKALGVLRLLATPANHKDGRAADPTVRGRWQGERFHLHSRLDREGLLRFFLEDYAPSPIVAPWNAGSGFYFREGKTKEKDPVTGKMIKTGIRDNEIEATRRIGWISRSPAVRLAAIAKAVASARTVVAEFSLDEAPEKGLKNALIERFRAVADETAADWIDAALVITGDRFDSAALLGSGGNDGNLDYSTTFHGALSELLDPETGVPRDNARIHLESALFDDPVTGIASTAVSQLSPGAIWAPNSGSGFWGHGHENPWSIVLMFEGAIAFAGTATKRGEASRSRGSFPFTVSQQASGSGAIGGEDESSKRPAELWLPLWPRPATYPELRSLLGEGRAHLGGRAAADGLSFARAVSTLEVSRGVAEFVRVGFEARYGNMFITVPLGRFRPPDRPRPDLVASLDAGGWLGKVRRLARDKNAPARARQAVRCLEDALFDMTREARAAEGVRGALTALGEVVAWPSRSREVREKVPPPPPLSRGWVRAADDGSAEFRIAAALAGLGWPSVDTMSTGGIAAESVDEADDQELPDGEAGTEAPVTAAPVDRSRAAVLLPMAAHFVPVDPVQVPKPFRHWDDKRAAGQPSAVKLAVWGGGGLVPNMIAVLERRLAEQAIRGLDDKPLAGAAPAGLADIAAFLEGPPGFDDARCAALLAGLVWARPASLRPRSGQAQRPFAYAALKPLFTPDADLRENGILPPAGGCRSRRACWPACGAATSTERCATRWPARAAPAFPC